MCEKCTICCGDTENKVRSILMLKIEAKQISQHTGKSIEQFAESVAEFEPYCFRMKKTKDKKCVFLQGSLCTIYELRPLVCRFYPFELKNAGDGRHIFDYTSECPAIGKGQRLGKSFFDELFLTSVKLMKEDAKRNDGFP
jgi:Fe-S-cluster containining protein